LLSFQHCAVKFSLRSQLPPLQSAPIDVIGELEPEEVLYEYDGPQIFVARTKSGDLLLAYRCWEDEDGEHLLIAPASWATISGLKVGRITVREALEQPWAWIANYRADVGLASVYRVDTRDLPELALPVRGTYLYLHLQFPRAAEQL